jgi:adenylate kinase family enzyme
MTPFKKIAVVGPPGCGKSTLARALSERLDLPRIEIDVLALAENGTEVADNELRHRIELAMKGTDVGWIVDGYYVRKLGDFVFRCADTVVWLDPSLAVCVLRVLRRSAGVVLRRKETFRRTFLGRESPLVWQLKNHGRRRREIPTLVERSPHLALVHLRSARDASRWLASLDHDPGSGAN